MLLPLKKILFVFTFNFSLFLLLMIGIQNSSKSGKINFIINDTVRLPISFIIGLSFISGSISGSLISITFNNKKK